MISSRRIYLPPVRRGCKAKDYFVEHPLDWLDPDTALIWPDNSLFGTFRCIADATHIDVTEPDPQSIVDAMLRIQPWSVYRGSVCYDSLDVAKAYCNFRAALGANWNELFSVSSLSSRGSFRTLLDQLLLVKMPCQSWPDNSKMKQRLLPRNGGVRATFEQLK